VFNKILKTTFGGVTSTDRLPALKISAIPDVSRGTGLGEKREKERIRRRGSGRV
jgi:hypothetical protein